MLFVVRYLFSLVDDILTPARFIVKSLAMHPMSRILFHVLFFVYSDLSLVIHGLPMWKVIFQDCDAVCVCIINR